MPRHLLRTLAAVATLLLVGQASFTVAGTRTVTVLRGDTLWGLSLRYRVPLDDLAAANGMQLSDVLLIGRRLKIPSGGLKIPPGVAQSQPKQAAPIPTAAVHPRQFTAADLAQM